MGTWSL